MLPPPVLSDGEQSQNAYDPPPNEAEDPMTLNGTMRRFLSIWFPNWPLTRLKRATERSASLKSDLDKPFVLVEKDHHGLCIAAANKAARACGIGDGLRFTDAKARAENLVSEEIDRQADHQALVKLAHWMIRIAPTVALDGNDGLVLETTGCERYYGGEPALMEQVTHLLQRNSIPHQMALAGTPGAAHGLARYQPGSCAASGQEKPALKSIPIAGLRLSLRAQTLLRRFGLTRIGQLYDIDRRAMARRFRSKNEAEAVLMRLDQALGFRQEPLAPLVPPPIFAARLPCPEPLLHSEGLSAGLQALTENICAQLKEKGQGARSFTFYAFRADGTHDAAALSTSKPTSLPDHLHSLFRDRLESIDPGFGIDLLSLHANRVGALQDTCPTLSGDLTGVGEDDHAISTLADRLIGRLGQDHVAIRMPLQSYLPEKAERQQRFEGEWPKPIAPPFWQGPRPQRLLDPPEPITVLAEVPDAPPRSFKWRRVQRRVVKADGPERLSPEWWRYTAPPKLPARSAELAQPWLTPKMDPRADADKIEEGRRSLEHALHRDEEQSQLVSNRPHARDYYRVEDEQGRRYWLYREGLYNDGPVRPQWFVHGLFA